MEYGPVNIQSLISIPNCKENSWYNLLYINNFQSQPELCLPVTWYLANDMQFFIITPPIVFILWKFETVGLALCGTNKILHLKAYFANLGCKDCFLYFAGVLTLTSSIIPTVLTYIHGWAPSPGTIGTIIDPRDPDYLEYMEYEYAKPWNRFSPYGIGILLGYLLHTTKGKHVKISKARHILSTNINCQKHISFSSQCFSY